MGLSAPPYDADCDSMTPGRRMRACCEPTDEGDAWEAARERMTIAPLQLVSVVERIYPATRKSRPARAGLAGTPPYDDSGWRKACHNVRG